MTRVTDEQLDDLLERTAESARATVAKHVDVEARVAEIRDEIERRRSGNV